MFIGFNFSGFTTPAMLNPSPTPSYLVRNRTLGPPLEDNPEIPPSSRDEGLRLLHGLATNLATWLPRHRKMKPFPAPAPQEKSHVRNWRSNRYLAPLMRPTKFPGIPVSLERNTEVLRHHFL